MVYNVYESNKVEGRPETELGTGVPFEGPAFVRTVHRLFYCSNTGQCSR